MPALPSGARVDLFGTTAAAQPHLAGTVLEDEVRGFVLTRTDSTGSMTVVGEGKLQLSVVQTSSDALHFHYRFRDLRLAPGASIRSLSIFGFGSIDTLEVDFRTDGLGEVGPAAANRSGVLNHVTFEFGGLTQPSLFFFIETQETAFDRDNPLIISAEDGTGAANAWIEGGFAPVPPS